MRRTLPLVLLIVMISFLAWWKMQKPDAPAAPQADAVWPPTHTQVGSYRDIPIYSNGEHVYKSHGKHYAEDGYYYGHQWQCVEFIKRFYYLAYAHQMPSVWGHAKDYFDTAIPHGQLNPARGMLQFHNGMDEKPAPDDLLVWNHEPYGHVAIITKVAKNSITVAQQNIKHAPTRELPLTYKDKQWLINPSSPPAGWLRIPKN